MPNNTCNIEIEIEDELEVSENEHDKAVSIGEWVAFAYEDCWYPDEVENTMDD